MAKIIRVAIMEDHQSIIDGYFMRLRDDKVFAITGTAQFGMDLEPMLASDPPDLLILDIDVPVSKINLSIFPTIQYIPKITRSYPGMAILVISMHSQIVLIEKLIELGVSGYIMKSDSSAIQNLDKIILSLMGGGTYFSQGIFPKLRSLKSGSENTLLTPRQFEVLSLCTEFPDEDSDSLAVRMGVSSSTIRNTLSDSYKVLGVHTRQAAISYFQKLGMGDNSQRKESSSQNKTTLGQDW